ncbi:MAG: four helix bundle protein [Chloroflexi bacterium]|nr:four helix bundle protein [Chloroflexota bacterium]
MHLIRANHQPSGGDGNSSFEDLQCYKLALDVMVNAHQLAVNLPPQEKYDLAQQIRRASKGISANIAEGYGRFHFLDSLRFYSMARGSLNETRNHVITAKVLGYIEESFYQQFVTLMREAEKTLNGLMRYVREQRRGGDLYKNSVIREEAGTYEAEFSDYLDELRPHE